MTFVTKKTIIINISPSLFVFLKSDRFGYMLSLRFLVKFKVAILDASKGVFDKCPKSMCQFGWQLLIVHEENQGYMYALIRWNMACIK